MNFPQERFLSSIDNSDSAADDNPIDELLDLLCDSQSERVISETQDNPESISTTTSDRDTISVTAADEAPIEVEIEASNQNLTLAAAVEYEAFLRQKAETESSSTIEPYQLAIDPETASSEELVAYVNALIPLMVELLQYQVNDSQEAIIKGVTPILERLIEQRATEEPEKMANALAQILPNAIAEKIKLSPEAIARAIAPELALSIREQIRLDENAISEALGSEMGKAIKNQIELERDAMVDALYPVIGSTISKYMVEVVQEINTKVENTLSPEGIKRKIRAKLRGVSEAELILQESIGCHVQAVFLIHKDSGLIIQEIQQLGERILDAEMVAGMLTAIRSFANDCIVFGSELDTIDYGDWQIHLEAAGYCYLAVVLQGDPNNRFINKIREIFGEIVLYHGTAIVDFDGNRDKVAPAITQKLEQLVNPEALQPNKSGSPTSLLWLIALIAALVLIPWGMVSHRSRVANNIEQLTAAQLDAAPEISVYRLEPTVKKGVLTVVGRVPSEDLRVTAVNISQKIAQDYNLQWNDQINVVDLPVNPGLMAGEISRLAKLFNQEPQVQISTDYQQGNLTIRGFILDRSRQEAILKAFAQIPGINRTIANIQDQLPQLPERIYFDNGSNQLNLAENSSKIESAIEFLNQYPELHLKLIAYSDVSGSKAINQQLGEQRCLSVRDTLIAKGVASNRLVSDCEEHRLSKEANQRAIWSTRYVRFEPLIPQMK